MTKKDRSTLLYILLHFSNHITEEEQAHSDVQDGAR